MADVIRQELARILREEVRDPRVGFTTVTEVDLSPDMRHARVFFSSLEDREDETRRALIRATPFIRGVLARTGGLRFTPSLQFVHDRSAATGARVEEILKQVRPADDEEPDA